MKFGKQDEILIIMLKFWSIDIPVLQQLQRPTSLQLALQQKYAASEDLELEEKFDIDLSNSHFGNINN